MTDRKVRYCPFCGKEVWGEGWQPETGEHFFSHKRSTKCCFEIAIKVRAIEMEESK